MHPVDLKDRLRQLRETSASYLGGADLNKKMLARLATRKTPTWRQLRYVGTVLTKAEKQLLGILSVVAVVAVGVVGVRLWQTHVVSVPARGGEYIEGLVGTPTYINPLYASANEVDVDITHLVYSGLIRVLPEGQVVPDLAETIEISEDGKTVTAVLRANARFHDGEPVKAEDVVFTYESVQNPAYKSVYAAAFRGVTITATDEHTVVFTLNEAYAPFFTGLTVGILPAHLWRDIPPHSATLAEFTLKPVGSGPYQFKSFARDRLGTIHSYTLERFAGYYGPPPFINRIALRFFPDYDAALEAYRARQIDGLGFAPYSFRDRLRARGDAHEYLLTLPQYTAVFFNPKRNDVLKDAGVREALQIVLDRERILREALGGAGELIDSPVLPTVIGNTTSSLRAPLDPARAVALLEKAGWVRVEGQPTRVKLTKDSKGKVTATSSLKITLTTVERDEMISTGNAIVTAWKDLGVDASLTVLPVAELQRDVLKAHTYDALLYGQILGQDPDPFAFWHSSQAVDGGRNLALYANRNADTLIESARKETDPLKRADILAQFAALVVGERPAIFLFRPQYTYFVSNRVKGIIANEVAIPADRFAGIGDWFIKTGKRWR